MYKQSSSHLVNFRKQGGGVLRKYLNVVDEYQMKFFLSNLRLIMSFEVVDE